MDFTIDPDTVAIAEAVQRFVEREVLPLQQRHHDLLGSERTLFETVVAPLTHAARAPGFVF